MITWVCLSSMTRQLRTMQDKHCCILQLLASCIGLTVSMSLLHSQMLSIQPAMGRQLYMCCRHEIVMTGTMKRTYQQLLPSSFRQEQGNALCCANAHCKCILHLSNHNTDVHIVMNILMLTACTGKCWACHCQKHCFVRH